MKKEHIKLSNLQISVMKILWEHEKLSVSQAHQLLNQHKPMALTTVATLLKRMHEKSIVGFEKVGRQHLYYPLVSEREVKSSMLSNMINHLFNNEPAELVHHLVDQKDISEDELSLIRKMLERSKK